MLALRERLKSGNRVLKQSQPNGKTALITGVVGQDGAYLARHLLELGYRVVGTVRRSSSDSFWRLRDLGVLDHVEIVNLELLEDSQITRVIRRFQPDEFYNLAAQSFVGSSFDEPVYVAETNGLAVLRILEALREYSPQTRFYQASTSEMFGFARVQPQSETTAFHPRSPYGVAKAFAHWITVNYREAHGLYTASGLLFNHESPLRGAEFVTRKIAAGLVAIATGRAGELRLGNLDAMRDWGFAGDYVVGMHQMLQLDEPTDFVLATGVNHSVREFIAASCAALDLSLAWEGEGLGEIGRVHGPGGEGRIVIDSAYFRPSEVDCLLGDASKAKRLLGWTPRVTFSGLVEMMCSAEMARLRP